MPNVGIYPNVYIITLVIVPLEGDEHQNSFGTRNRGHTLFRDPKIRSLIPEIELSGIVRATNVPKSVPGPTHVIHIPLTEMR